MCFDRKLFALLVAAALLVPAVLPGAVRGQADEPEIIEDIDDDGYTPTQIDSVLSDRRWVDEDFGLSLRLPHDARVDEVKGARPRLRLIGEAGYAISVFVRRSPEPMSVNALRENELEEALSVQPNIEVLQQAAGLVIQGRPASLIYFRVPLPTDESAEGEPAAEDPAQVIGQIIVLANPQTAVMIQLDAPWRGFRRVAPIYQMVVDSIEFAETPRRASTTPERIEMLRGGEAWLDGLTWESILASLIHERYFRVLRDGPDGEDIGYMHVTQRPARRLERDGVEVRIVARMRIGRETFDSESAFFVDVTGREELWSVRIESTPLPHPDRPDAKRPTVVQLVETGTRAPELGGSVIAVSRSGLAGQFEVRWPQPPRSYLPTAFTHLFDQLIAKNKPVSLGFYAYNVSSGRLSYRSEVLETLPGGASRLRSRVGADGPEQVTYFDARGAMVRREMPNGTVVIPATQAEILQRWELR